MVHRLSNRSRVGICALALTLTFLSTSSAMAQADFVDLHLQPSAQEVMVGEQFLVDLYLQRVGPAGDEHLYIAGADVIITWDPTVLKLVWADPGNDVFLENDAEYNFFMSEFAEDSALDGLNNDLAAPDLFTTFTECDADTSVCDAYEGSTCDIRACTGDYMCKHHYLGLSECSEDRGVDGYNDDYGVCPSPPASGCTAGYPQHFEDCCDDDEFNCCSLVGTEHLHDGGETTYYEHNFQCYDCTCSVNFCSFTKLPYNDGVAVLHLLTQPGTLRSGEPAALDVPWGGHKAGSFAFEAIGPGSTAVSMLEEGPAPNLYGTVTDVVGRDYPYTGADIMRYASSSAGVTVTACEQPIVQKDGPSPRYMKITVPGNPNVPVALKITGLSDDVACMTGYVKAPLPSQAGSTDWQDHVADVTMGIPEPEDMVWYYAVPGNVPIIVDPGAPDPDSDPDNAGAWGDEIWVTGEWILPSREYRVEADCSKQNPASFFLEADYGDCDGSPCVSKVMPLSGDLAAYNSADPNNAGGPGHPNGICNLTDILAALNMFGPVGELNDLIADMAGGNVNATCLPNKTVNITDLLRVIAAFGPPPPLGPMPPDPCNALVVEGFCGP